MSQQIFSYGVEGVFIGSRSPYSPNFESAATLPVEGVQSANITLSYPRQDTADWAGGGTPILVNRPRAELDFSYVFSSGTNELNLGFLTNGTPALLGMYTEQNYYVLINKDHLDLIGYQGTNSNVLAFGNGIITRYAFEAGVGRLSTATVNVEALNLLIQASGTGQPLPSVFLQPGTYPTGLYTLPAFTQQVQNHFETMPASISLTFDSGCAIGAMLSGNQTCPIQNFGFTINMARQDALNLGWAYPQSRPLRYPLTIQIHADAYLNGFQLDALNRFGCPDSGYNFTVGFENSCTSLDSFQFQFVGANLDTESFAMQIGDQNKVTFNWTVNIYDINRVSGEIGNFFINTSQTAYSSIIFPQVSYGTGVGQQPLVMNLSSPSYLSIFSGPAIITGGNYVVISDDPAQTVIRVAVSGTSEIEYVIAGVS